jgi:hypothetical protein
VTCDVVNKKILYACQDLISASLSELFWDDISTVSTNVPIIEDHLATTASRPSPLGHENEET